MINSANNPAVETSMISNVFDELQVKGDMAFPASINCMENEFKASIVDEELAAGSMNLDLTGPIDTEESSTKENVENQSGESGVGTATQHCRRKKLTKAEASEVTMLLAKDINENGPRHPMEFARKYQITEYRAGKLIAKAAMKGLITTAEKVSYDVKEAKCLPSWQRDYLGIEDTALVRIDYDQSAVMISII